ncbi:hypothetical protein PS645_00239 [Pseudomonas fluorescens]|uniref:Uncharacterized protein n=1 Tax=Pseudomonas fluorescens TaxID=294 RepID=A0A5E6PAC4_PSEFL|nr:hypothetical protein [Pseudomonas fluorescens]VVM40276.1 hypothetical protein PS645_00239 [Pseudomonas fluorescens]
MSGKSKDTTQNPEEPYPPGEVERDNDALRPTDPTRRKENGKGTESGESTAQETADKS